jgi:hypothetical protein
MQQMPAREALVLQLYYLVDMTERNGRNNHI